MRKVFSVSLVAAVALISSAFIPKENKAVTSTYVVSTDKSKIEWTGSKASGYHDGSFALKSGNLQTTDGKLTGGKFVIDLTSIKSDAEPLTGHLKNKDFFDVAQFSEATFTITKVNYTDAKNATISGDLNLHGITAPLTFASAIRSADDKGFFGQAFFTIDRTKWGISYGAPDKVASDVQIKINLFGTKQ
jgi:polyisoprenoid-binding protein YceI